MNETDITLIVILWLVGLWINHRIRKKKRYENEEN